MFIGLNHLCAVLKKQWFSITVTEFHVQYKVVSNECLWFVRLS